MKKRFEKLPKMSIEEMRAYHNMREIMKGLESAAREKPYSLPYQEEVRKKVLSSVEKYETIIPQKTRNSLEISEQMLNELKKKYA